MSASNLLNKKSPVSKLYARALFELTQEQKNSDAVLEELKDLFYFLDEKKSAVKPLLSTGIPYEQRSIVAEELAKTLQLAPTLKRLFVLLAEKNRLEIIGSIYSAFRLLVDSNNGLVRGEVITTESLNENEKKELEKAFEKKLGKKVILESQINKEIIGGLIVKVQGLTFDGSIKTTLNNLKSNLERHWV